MKTKAIYISVALLAGSLLPTQAAVLLDDTFADGSRGETSLPNESAVWISHPDDVTMNVGSLLYAQTSSSHKMWTYFTDDGAPVSLGVGDQLIANVDFTPRVALYDNTSRSFRFGLFNDPTDSQLKSDMNSDSGGGAWTDSLGYGVQIAPSSGSGTTPNVGKRTDQTVTSLMGSGSAWTFTSGGNAIGNVLDASYTLTLALNRVAADQMSVTFSITDAGGGLISTYSILDDPNGAGTYGTGPIATSFDQLFFRFSNNTTTADALEFNRIRIDYIPAVPEPSCLALLGLGGLAIRILRRRS